MPARFYEYSTTNKDKVQVVLVDLEEVTALSRDHRAVTMWMKSGIRFEWDMHGDDDVEKAVDEVYKELHEKWRAWQCRYRSCVVQ